MSTKHEKARQKPNNKITYVPKPLPPEGFVRLASVLAVLGVSKTCYLDGVKSGKFPQGKLLSPRCRVYPVSEIRALLASLENEEAA
jgi:prophage regulatory protein